MSTACIIENKKRFSQTFDTPPLCAALIDKVGYDAENKMDKQILEGTFFSPLDTPQYMQKVLDRLRMPQLVVHRGPISTLISTQEHMQRWEKEKERTASYQGELNVNDFKAGSQDEIITKLGYLSRKISLAKGFAPDSCKQITDFQILKKK